MSERAAWIALASTPGVGDVTFARLLEIHGTATAALSAVDRLPAGRADRALSEMLRTRLRPGVARAIRRSAGDLAKMRKAGRVVAEMHSCIREAIRPGVTTAELDRIGRDVIERISAEMPLVPAEASYRGEVAQRWAYADGTGEGYGAP